MIRQPLNIWRVYLDLFANFMGLVLLGGAGLMIMIGSTALRVHRDPPSLSGICVGKNETGVANFVKGGNDQKAVMDGCEIRGEYPGIVYTQGQTLLAGFDRETGRPVDAANAGVKGVQALCRNLFKLVAFAKVQHSLGYNVAVEVVGHASREYKETSDCAYPLKALQRERRLYPHLIEMLKQFSWGPVFDTSTAANYLCNARVASLRAGNVVNECLVQAKADGERSFVDDVSDFVIVSADPKNLLNRENEVCGGQESDQAEKCRRTVTVLLRLPDSATRTSQKAEKELSRRR